MRKILLIGKYSIIIFLLFDSPYDLNTVYSSISIYTFNCNACNFFNRNVYTDDEPTEVQVTPDITQYTLNGLDSDGVYEVYVIPYSR